MSEKTEMLLNMMKEAMIQRIKSLPEPLNYFAGTPEVSLRLPKNILVFGRFSGKLPSVYDMVHHRFLFAVNLEGEGNVVVDGVRHSFFPGDGFLIFPHQYHHFFYSTSRIQWIFITFEQQESEHLEKLRNRAAALSVEAMQFLQLLLDYYQDKNESEFIGLHQIVLLTQLLLNELLRKSLSPHQSHPPRFIDQVNRYIDARISHRLTLSAVARHFSYSPSHFRAVYKKNMGVSIGKYIQTMRLHKAQGLLGTTDMTISEIGDACGYHSLYSFSHAFKNYFKISPVACRDAIHNKNK
jgi:AraC-like DNA-binding protein